MMHHPDCDVNDINPDGIVKPCNCAERGASLAAPNGYALPMRGDKYYWHTGGTVTVVRVDGSLTVVQTPAGSMVNVPTGTLMKTPKAHTDKSSHCAGRKDNDAK